MDTVDILLGIELYSVHTLRTSLSYKKTAIPVDSELGIVIFICSALNSAPTA